MYCFVVFVTYSASTYIYTYWHTLSLHVALPICPRPVPSRWTRRGWLPPRRDCRPPARVTAPARRRCPAPPASAVTCAPRRRRYRPAGTVATVRARPPLPGPPAPPRRYQVKRARRLGNDRASPRWPAARQGWRKGHAGTPGCLPVWSGGGIDQGGDMAAVAH